MTDIKVPELPESVSDATVSKWYKQPGDAIKRDENVVDLETDKVMLEVTAPADGVLKDINKNEGDVVTAGEVLGTYSEGGDGAKEEKKEEKSEDKDKSKEGEKEEKEESKEKESDESESSGDVSDLSPAVRRLVQEHDVDVSQIKGSGKGGRIVKSDVEEFIKSGKGKSAAKATPSAAGKAEKSKGTVTAGREEKRVPMSRIRARIAERLVQVKQETAMLTTFNEVNMKPIMDIRSEHKEQFEKTHGVKLGFMSFFVKAVVEALKNFPAVNASIDDKDIVYHGFFDIGIAVSTERGLVVPVLRDADQMSMAEIEKSIRSYAERARDNKLTMEDMTGGTFTITNGGVFGSMLSTPIINAPQSAILGMHNIVERPVVEDGEIVVRPIMYVAMSYDHRIIDGKESVSFLVSVKNHLEDPARMLLEL